MDFFNKPFMMEQATLTEQKFICGACWCALPVPCCKLLARYVCVCARW